MINYLSPFLKTGIGNYPIDGCKKYFTLQFVANFLPKRSSNWLTCDEYFNYRPAIDARINIRH